MKAFAKCSPYVVKLWWSIPFLFATFDVNNNSQLGFCDVTTRWGKLQLDYYYYYQSHRQCLRFLMMKVSCTIHLWLVSDLAVTSPKSKMAVISRA